METATIREAQHHLSKLIRRVEQGEEIVLTRRGKKLVKLSLYNDESADSPLVLPDFTALRRKMGTDQSSGPNAVLQLREETE